MHPSGKSCPVYQKKEERRVQSEGRGGMPEGSAKRVPNFREEPKSVSIARLPSLPELKEGINAIFSHRVRGIIEQEDSILRYGGCNSSQINAGKCRQMFTDSQCIREILSFFQSRGDL